MNSQRFLTTGLWMLCAACVFYAAVGAPTASSTRAEETDGDQAAGEASNELAAPAPQESQTEGETGAENAERKGGEDEASEDEASQADASEDGGREKVSYDRQIRPILQAHCQGCHQPAKAGGGYDMTNFASLKKGGESEIAAVVPGDPDESNLIDVITPLDGEAYMPQDRPPLSEAEIELIRRWIAQGAENDAPEAGSRYDMQNPPQYTRPPVVTALDYSPDGSLLAVAGFHEVLLMSADGSERTARLVGLAERIESVRFSPDGTRLAVAGGLPGRMGELQVWDVAERKLKLSLAVTSDTIYGGKWSPDGTLIAFGCADNSIRAVNAETGEQVLYQGAHDDWPLDTVFSTDGSHLISVGRDMTAKLTEVDTERFIDNITSITPGALKGGIASVARHPERDELVIGGSDGVAKVYRIYRQAERRIGDDSNLVRRMPAMTGRIHSVAVSRDGKRIAAGSSLDGTGLVHVYSYEFDPSLPDDIKVIMTKTVQQRSAEEKAKLDAWHTQDVQLVAETKVAQAGVYAVAFHPDGTRLAAAGTDGTVRLIDAATGDIVGEFAPAPLTEESERPVVAEQAIRAARQTLEPEQLPGGSRLTDLVAEPAEVRLTNRFESVQLLITGLMESGDPVDVTRMVSAGLSNDVVHVSPTGLIQPLADGTAQLTLTLGEISTTVPVSVTGIDADYQADFIADVNPVLSKLGCNAGTCHGSQDGQKGFKLSLRGYDPLFDVRALTDDLAGRRVNVASPDDSLMLLKTTGRVPHVGGQLTRPGEPYYELVRNWIAGGARLDLSTPRVTGIEVFPENPVIQQIGGTQQIRVVAKYADGRARDVTREAFVDSGDTEIAEAAGDGGLFVSLRRGEAPLLARYEGAYAATTLTVMGDRSGFVWEQPPTWGRIDELTAEKWERMKIQPSPLAEDAEFLRRVTLDLTGLPPTAEELRAFLNDPRETRIKRDEVVDRLVGGTEFVDFWTNKWADLLLVNRKFLGAEGAKSFRDWIREQVDQNTPYDEFARSILTAEGSNRENPPAAYYKILRDPDEIMENTTHLFLAIRFNCNKCHDHPFERWTQDQYYETAAYFARVGLRRDPESGDRRIGGTAVEGAKPLYEIVYEKNDGEITHERTGQVTPPAFPFACDYETPEGASRRSELAAWITAPDNPYFARSYVNRVWGYLFGRGLIEPIDDIRAGNPPTNPELLDYLTEEFIHSGFDTRHVFRLIAKSRTYQLSVTTNRFNEDDDVNYSHAVARRLPAEVLYDAIHRVTGAPPKLPGVPAGTRAAALPDVGIELADGFLNKFGRPSRESACECERSSELQLGPVMALISGPTISEAIAHPNNDLPKLVAQFEDDRELIGELFLRILNRPAADAEIDAVLESMDVIDADHARITEARDKIEAEQAPIIAELEAKREAAIAAAAAALKAYEEEIADKIAERERKEQARVERVAQLEAELKAYEAAIDEHRAAWEARQSQPIDWVPLTAQSLSASNGATLTQEDDRSIFVTGDQGKGTYEIVAQTDLTGVTAVRLEALADERLPNKGPGRAQNGNFVLTEFELFSADPADPNERTQVVLQNAVADFSQNGYDVATAIDGKRAEQGNGWAIQPQTGQNRVAVFQIRDDVGQSGEAVLTFRLDQQYSDGRHALGRFRLSVTTAQRPVDLGPPADIAAILAVAPDQRNDAQKKKLMEHFRKIDPQLNKLTQLLAEAKKPTPVDPGLTERRKQLAEAEKPIPLDPRLVELRRIHQLSTQQLEKKRLTAAQDLAWALINSPAFLFNH